MKLLVIFCCDDCPNLAPTNWCYEIERIITDHKGSIPKDCPLEEAQERE